MQFLFPGVVKPLSFDWIQVKLVSMRSIYKLVVHCCVHVVEGNAYHRTLNKWNLLMQS